MKAHFLKDWTLYDEVLQPNETHLKMILNHLRSNAEEDKVIQVIFPEPCQETAPNKTVSIRFHKALLSRLSEPFRALLTGPFSETHKRKISLLGESIETFQAVQQFAYGIDIDLSKFDFRLAFCANKWELPTLYEAVLYSRLYFRPIEETVTDFASHMRFLPLPNRWKACFARLFAMNIEALEKELGSDKIWAGFLECGDSEYNGEKITQTELLKVIENENSVNNLTGSVLPNGGENDSSPVEGKAEKLDSTANSITHSKGSTFEEIMDQNNIHLWMEFTRHGMLKEVVRQLCFFNKVDRFNAILSVICSLEDDIEEDVMEAIVFFLDSARVIQESQLEEVNFKVLKAAVAVSCLSGRYDGTIEKHVCKLEWGKIKERNVLWDKSAIGYDVSTEYNKDDCHLRLIIKKFNSDKAAASFLVRATVLPCCCVDLSNPENGCDFIGGNWTGSAYVHNCIISILMNPKEIKDFERTHTSDEGNCGLLICLMIVQEGDRAGKDPLRLDDKLYLQSFQ